LSYTIVDDEHDFIHVRAIIDAKNEPKELTHLIDALVRRAGQRDPTKEVTRERPDA
jgi:hypothetical protein